MDFKQNVVRLIVEKTKADQMIVEQAIEIPPQRLMGDYAFPCFFLSKMMRKPPQQIARELASDMTATPNWLARVEAVGPYLNFHLDRAFFSLHVVKEVLQQQEQFASSHEGDGKMVLIEYSSPNIAKPFHVGHGVTTVLGHSLARIYEKRGYQVVRLNHIGDYGTQFGKLIVAYQRWGDEAALREDPIGELLRIYVKYHKEEKTDPGLADAARDHFRRLEHDKEPEKTLWTMFRDLSLKEFSRVYDRLGIEFDSYLGEAYYSDQIDKVIKRLDNDQLLTQSDGARVVMLDEFDLPPCIIVKSDGTTIYASRDLAAAMYRHETYNFFKNIYVVGSPQALHFRQVFAVLQKANLPYANDCVHVGFGLVKFADMKFSTREGHVIALEELIDECVKKTREVIEKNAVIRQTTMSEKERAAIAEKVGIGAVMYTYLKSGRERDIVFSWDDMLDFEGDTAPYLMYTYARAKSILRKASEQKLQPVLNSDDAIHPFSTDDEYEICRHIYEVPETLQKACEQHEPFMIARLASRLARAFNRFYNQTPILSDENLAIKQARLALCESSCLVLREMMRLLGIEAVEQM